MQPTGYPRIGHRRHYGHTGCIQLSLQNLLCTSFIFVLSFGWSVESSHSPCPSVLNILGYKFGFLFYVLFACGLFILHFPVAARKTNYSQRDANVQKKQRMKERWTGNGGERPNQANNGLNAERTEQEKCWGSGRTTVLSRRENRLNCSYYFEIK